MAAVPRPSIALCGFTAECPQVTDEGLPYPAIVDKARCAYPAPGGELGRQSRGKRTER